MNFIQSLIYGLIAGLSDILPVSSQAHKAVLLKLFGQESESPILRLLIHVAILAALYCGCQNQIQRILRQQKLSKIPKRRRKRPVDMCSMMELRVLRTMLIPVLLGFGIHFKTASLEGNLAWIAVFLVVNGAVLFLPVLLPSGNKDSRAMTRIDGVAMGFGSAASAFPGISSVGAAASSGMIRGVERSYAINLALLVHIGVTAGSVLYDLIALILFDVGAFGFGILLGYLAAALAAFIGVWLGMRLIRTLAVHIDVFAYYCWGLALLAFILFLSV